jgi:hypothetical protein
VKITSPLENKQALFWLFLANTISGAAQGISLIAIPWYFIDMLRKAELFSLFYGILTLLSIFWVVYAGALIDKYKRRELFKLLNVVSGILVLAMAGWSYQSGEAQFIPALVVLAVTVLNFNLHYPSLYAFAQEITPKAYYARVVSYLEIQGQATSVLSGALAAVLLKGSVAGDSINVLGLQLQLPIEITPWKLHQIFLLDGLTYFGAFVCVSLIRYRPQMLPLPATGNALLRIREGFGYLKARPYLMLFGILSYAVFVSVLVEDKILLPEYVRTQLGASADVYASASIWFAAGALLSGVINRRLFARWHPVAAMSFLFCFIAVFFLGCVWRKEINYLYFFSLLFGYVNTGVRILRVSFLFTFVPNAIMGRLLSFFKVADTLMRSLFIALFSFSWFHIDNNIRFGYLIFGIFIGLCGLLMLTTRRHLANTNHA